MSGVVVTFDPNSINKQSQVIPVATPGSDGVMSKEQAAKLAGLTPGEPGPPGPPGPNLANVADYASLPAASTKAWLFYTTDDDGAVYYSNGAEWVAVGGSASAPAPGIFLWNVATKTWADLWAEVLAAAAGGLPSGIIRVTSSAPGVRAVVNVGNYDFSNIQWEGSNLFDVNTDGWTVVQFADGVTLVDSLSVGYVLLSGSHIAFEALGKLTDGANVYLYLSAGATIFGPGIPFANCLVFYASVDASLINVADPYGVAANPLVTFSPDGGSGNVSLARGSTAGNAIFGGTVAGSAFIVYDRPTTAPSNAAWSGAVVPTTTAPASPAAFLRRCTSAIPANVFVKQSTTVAQAVTAWLKTDSVDLIVGVSREAGVSGSYVRVTELIYGATLTLKTDGVGGGVLPIGTLVDFSTITDGFVTKGAGGKVAGVVRIQANNVAGTSVTVTVRPAL